MKFQLGFPWQFFFKFLLEILRVEMSFPSTTVLYVRNMYVIWRKSNRGRGWRRLDCLQGNFSHQRGIKMSCWQTADVQLIINKTAADLHTRPLFQDMQWFYKLSLFLVVRTEDPRKNITFVKAVKKQHSLKKKIKSINNTK